MEKKEGEEEEGGVKDGEVKEEEVEEKKEEEEEREVKEEEEAVEGSLPSTGDLILSSSQQLLPVTLPYSHTDFYASPCILRCDWMSLSTLCHLDECLPLRPSHVALTNPSTGSRV